MPEGKRRFQLRSERPGEETLREEKRARLSKYKEQDKENEQKNV